MKTTKAKDGEALRPFDWGLRRPFCQALGARRLSEGHSDTNTGLRSLRSLRTQREESTTRFSKLHPVADMGALNYNDLSYLQE